MADEIDGKIQDRLTPDPDMERAEPLLAERAPDATPWAESGAFGTDVGAPPPPPTETDIMRTFAKPSARAIEALRLNPQYADDFDMKYGGGAAVQNLFDAKPPAGTQIDPHVARPTVTWSTRDLLEASKERPAIWGLVDGFLNEDALRQGALRDRAAFGSLQAFRRGPAATTEPAWLEQEIAVGEARVDDFRRREQEALASGRGLTPLEETAKRVAEHRLEAAQAARADIDDKIIRQAESQVQLVIAERLAEQKQRVAYAQDQLEQFDRDPTVGEQTGRGRDFFADALRSERKKLQLLDDAFEYARQRVSVPDATGRGEVARSFLRAVIADTPEMLAGAMARLGKDSENGAAARDLAEEMRRTVRGWRQDTAAPARGEFLALDPKSPTFANDLKLWSAHALGQGLGTSAATIVAAMAAGPFGAFGTGMAMGVGQMENALEDAFAKEGLRFAEHDRPELVYGLGAAIGALDSFALLFNLGQVGGPVKNAAVRNIASAIARGAAKGAAMEGVTEAMQESLQMLGEAYALEKGIDWKEYARRSVEAFAAGAVPGSVFGARQGRRDNDIARGRQMVEEIRRLVEAESRVEPVAPVPAEPDKAEPATEKPVPVVELPDPVPVSAAAVEKARDKGALAPEDMRDLAEIGRRVEIADPTLPDADIIARMTEQRQRGATFTPDFDAKLDAIIATVDPVPVEDRPVAAPDPEAEAKAAAAQEVVADRRLGETLTQIADQAETIRRLQVQIGSAPDGMNTAPLQDALQQAAATQRTLNRQKNDLEKTVAEFVADRAKRPPRTLAEGLQRVGIAAWLDRGASLDMADRSAVAESLGVDPDQVVPLLETEVLAGRLRKDSRGRYRRMPGAEPTSGDAAVSTGARAQIQALIEAELDAGRPVQIPPAITLRILNGMTPSAGLLPPGYRMAAPARFEPVPDSGTVAVEMMTADGASVVFRVDRDLLLGSRALTLSRFGLVASARLFLGDGDGLLKTLGGEVRHEIVHAQWGRVPGPVKQRLVGHANALGVLDRTVGDVLDAVGEDGGGDTRTLRQAYSIIYADRSNLQDVLDQEAVAHMVELGYHDALDVEQLAPVADDMAVVFGGAFAQQDARLAAMPMAALDADTGRSMRRDLDALGYYSKALEAARSLKQAKGTPEQMFKAVVEAPGVRANEIIATKVHQFILGDEGAGLFERVVALRNAVEEQRQSITKTMPALVRKADETDKAWGVRRKDRTAEIERRIGQPVQDLAEAETALSKFGSSDRRDSGAVIDPAAQAGKSVATIEPEVWGPKFQKLMSGEYAIAVAGGDLSTQLDILTAKYFNGNVDSPQLKVTIGAEIERLRRELGPEWMATYAPDARPIQLALPSGDRTNGSASRSGSLNQITKSQIISWLEENRVGLKEVKYGDTTIPPQIKSAMEERDTLVQWLHQNDTPELRNTPEFLAQGDRVNRLHDVIDDWDRSGASNTKWSRHSLDPSNPTYRETVLHLPEIPVGVPREVANTAPRGWGDGPTMLNDEFIARDRNFRAGHFPEPNVVGHMMTSMVSDGKGKPVYLIDQIQSDWGQKLRDGGVRDEAKITDLAKRKDQAEDAVVVAIKGAGLSVRELGSDRVKWPVAVREAQERMELLSAELRTAEASASGNPLVNTTDQWVNTTLRRAIRQAVEADADAIAIPSGKTVLSYNPGDEAGMEGFYNQIVPKNLRNLLQRLDKSAPDGEKVAKLGTPTKGEAGEGFTVFRLTPAVKRSVIEEGQPMFALGGRPLPDGHSRVAWGGLGQPPKPLYELIADLNTALGLTTRLGHLNPGLKAAAGARGGKLHGQHSRNTDVVRLAFANDLDVLAHEGGHALETRFGNDLRVIMDAHRAELEPLGTPGRDSLSEGFAEFFRRYVVNPSTAETKAPKFFKAFENFLDAREPPMLAAVQNVSDDYQSWIDAPSGGAVASHIVSTRNDGLVAEMTKHVRRNGFQNVSSQFFHGAYTMLVDRLHPISQAVSRLIDIAQINIAAPLRGHIAVTAANDPYKLLRLARNGYQTGHLDLMRGVRPYHGAGHEGPSMHEAIGRALGGFASEQWTDDRLQAFGAYLAARRMVAEWDRFKSGELDRPPDLLSRADHAQAVGDYEAANPTFAAAADMVHAYLRNMLAKARDAGFVSRETFDELSRRKDYVPVNRNREDDAGLDPQGQAAATRGGNKASLLKGFRGSTRDIINPLESIARASYEWNFVIARNEAIRALDRLARAVGPGGGAIAERLPAHAMTGTPVNAVDVVKQAGRQAGVAEEDMIFLVGALEEALGQDADTVLFRPGLISENGEAIVWLWEDGKRVPIRLPDGRFGKWMYEAITDLGVETMPAVLEIMSKPSQWLRAGVTRDPGYMLANLARDNLSAWVLSNEHGSLLPNFAGSASAAAAAVGDAFGRRDESLDLLRSFGGITGGFGQEGMNAARIDRDIRGLRKKGIRLTSAVLPHRKEFWEITGASETGTRLAVFRKALERAAADGLNEYEALVEAAYTANDLLDFGRYGSRMLAARRLITFLNSQIQGMDKGVRTSIGFSETYTTLAQVASPFLRQGEGHVLTAAERQRVPVAAKAWAKMIIGFGLPAFLMSWMYRDDDEYQEIPEYFRTTHWVFRDPSGVWRRIPKPFELSAGSLVIERAFEAYYMRDGKAAERLGEGLKRLVMPTHTVPGVQVAYELWANKSGFTGAPIVPQHLSKLPGELQFTAYTSELAKWLAVMTGQSAAKIDHAIAGITGSLGRSALDASNRIMPPIGQGLESLGLPRMGISPTPRPELRQSETIFVRRFTVDPARSAQSKKDFWEKMSETTGTYAVKSQGYKEFYDRAQFSEASDMLARATPNERAFMLLEGHGTASEKRGHPLSRARQVLSVTNGVRRDLDTGKLKDDQGNEYSPSDRRVIQEMIEQVQMREARNAQVVLGEKGYENKKIMPVAPILAEIEAKIPSIAEEIEYRLRKAKVRDFDDVAADWPTLKADVLDPGYAPDNPPRRKVGRRAP